MAQELTQRVVNVSPSITYKIVQTTKKGDTANDKM